MLIWAAAIRSSAHATAVSTHQSPDKQHAPISNRHKRVSDARQIYRALYPIRAVPSIPYIPSASCRAPHCTARDKLGPSQHERALEGCDCVGLECLAGLRHADDHDDARAPLQPQASVEYRRHTQQLLAVHM